MKLLRSAKADRNTLKSTARNALMFQEFAFDPVRKSGLLELGEPCVILPCSVMGNT